MTVICAKYLNNKKKFESTKDNRRCKGNSNRDKCSLKFVQYVDPWTTWQFVASLTIWSSNLEKSGLPLYRGPHEKRNGVGEGECTK